MHLDQSSIPGQRCPIEGQNTLERRCAGAYFIAKSLEAQNQCSTSLSSPIPLEG